MPWQETANISSFVDFLAVLRQILTDLSKTLTELNQCIYFTHKGQKFSVIGMLRYIFKRVQTVFSKYLLPALALSNCQYQSTSMKT